MKKMLKKSDIFSIAKKSFEPKSVYVPDWDGEILYRPMSMTERRQIRKKCMISSVDDMGNPIQEIDQEMMEIWAIITCVLDPEDQSRKKLMFGPQDVITLESEISAGCISVISMAILQDSGLANSSFRKDEKEVEKRS